jgi:hypothetical protein
VPIVLVHIPEVVTGANLPIGKREDVAQIVESFLIEEYEVRIRSDAAYESLRSALAGFVSSVDQSGDVTDISARKIAYIADVEGDSTFALQEFEVIALELFQEPGPVSQHWVKHFGFKRESEQQKRQEAVDKCVALGLHSLVEGGGAQLEDVPKDGEEEGPNEVAGSLDLLASEGCETEQHRKGQVGQEGRYGEAASTKQQKDSEDPKEKHSDSE